MKTKYFVVVYYFFFIVNSLLSQILDTKLGKHFDGIRILENVNGYPYCEENYHEGLLLSATFFTKDSLPREVIYYCGTYKIRQYYRLPGDSYLELGYDSLTKNKYVSLKPHYDSLTKSKNISFEILYDTLTKREYLKWYRRDGSLKEYSSYLRGIELGEFSEFYPNGNYKCIGFYHYFTADSLNPSATSDTSFSLYNNYIIKRNHYNVKNGKWIYFHENGSLQRIEFYQAGNPVGKWRYYNENGDLLEIEDKTMKR